MKKHPKHATPEAAIEDDALEEAQGFDDIDAGDDLAAGEDADLEIDASLDEVEGLDAGDALEDAAGLEAPEALEEAEGPEAADAAADGPLEVAETLDEADDAGLAIADDEEGALEAADGEAEADGLDASLDDDMGANDAPRRGGDTGECPPIANDDTPLATIEEPPVISAAHPGEAPMVEVDDGHGGTVALCQVLPLEYLENKEDFPNLFPPRPKPGSLRRTTSARGGRRQQDVELTPEQLEMRRKQDARAKLIIYGALAFVTFAFLVLLSWRLPYLARLCGKQMDPIWPWSVIDPPAPPEEEDAPAQGAAAKRNKAANKNKGKAAKPAAAATAETPAAADDAAGGEDDDAAAGEKDDDAADEASGEEKKEGVVTEQPADGDW